MRQILNIETNKIETVEDQAATDMIASGKAVPSIEQMDADLSDVETGPIVITETK